LLIEHNSDRILAVADLHIGWEVTLAQKGIHIPSQTPKLLQKIIEVIRICKPTRIVLLGDVKHTVARIELEEWRDVPDFFEKILELVPDVQVLPGNHDGNLEPLTPKSVRILESSGVAEGDIGLLHGHSWPSPALLGSSCLVMGHLHPVVMFRDVLGFRVLRQVWVKGQCSVDRLASSMLRYLNIRAEGPPTDVLREKFDVKLEKLECIIMPSFNDYLGGQPINRAGSQGVEKMRTEYIGPLLRSGSVDLENAELYMLDGTYLGRIKQLRDFA